MFVSEVKRPSVLHNLRHQHVAKDSGAGRQLTGSLHETELQFMQCDFGSLNKDCLRLDLCLEGTKLKGYFFM
jgi:hypothetical protein